MEEEELDKSALKYFEHGAVELEKFWKRFGGKPNLNASFLDVGCGHGALCIDLAKSGAKKVIGVDIEPERIKFARNNLNINYPELKNIVDFHAVDLAYYNNSEQFDYIVSKDSFEHIIDLPAMIEEMKKRLKPGGLVYAGFGPLYRDFYGDHKRTNSIIPWGHLFRSDENIIKKLNRKNDVNISSIYDLGLNKLSLVEYKEIFEKSGLETVFFKLNNSNHPILKFFNLLAKFPFLTEYFAHNIYCILRKKCVDD